MTGFWRTFTLSIILTAVLGTVLPLDALGQAPAAPSKKCIGEMGSTAGEFDENLPRNPYKAPKQSTLGIMKKFPQCECRGVRKRGFGVFGVYWPGTAGNWYQRVVSNDLGQRAYRDAAGRIPEAAQLVGRPPMLFCPMPVVNEMVKLGWTEAKVAEASWYEKPIIWGINNILWLIAWFGLWAMEFLSSWVGNLLGTGSFITNSIVRNGWIFVLGIANLGFVLALLFIALMTILRVGGMDARRMLVRLLIAALLINFSLIIGGVIIDISRLIMAGMARFLGDTHINGIGFEILKSSEIAGVSVKSKIKPDGSVGSSLQNWVPNNSWTDVAGAVQATVLIWVLVLAFAILTLGLLMRFVMLLLLLIISPLAYLAIALPNTGHLASQWWKRFMTEVFYGPAALFILLLIAMVNKTKDAFPDNPGFGSFVSVVATAGLLWAAAVKGRQLGVIGGAALVGGVAGYMKGAAWGAGRKAVYPIRHPIRTGAGLRQAGRFAERWMTPGGTVRQARRDAKKEEKKKLKDLPAERAREAGRKEAREKYGPEYAMTSEQKQLRSDVQAAGTTNVNASALSAENIGQAEVAQALSADQIELVMRDQAAGGGSDEQKSALIGALASMPDYLASTLTKAQVKAVLDTNNLDLMDAMLGNVDIVNNMDASTRADVETKLQSPQTAGGVKPDSAPNYSTIAPQQAGESDVDYDIRSRRKESEIRREWEKDRSDWKGAFKAFSKSRIEANRRTTKA